MEGGPTEGSGVLLVGVEETNEQVIFLREERDRSQFRSECQGDLGLKCIIRRKWRSWKMLESSRTKHF